MKKKYILPFLLLFLYSFKLFSQDKIIISCNEMIPLMELLKEYHISPQTLNDDFSHKLFDDFIEQIDSRYQYFLEDDFETLKVYRDAMDNHIQNNSCEFLNEFANKYKNRLAKIKDLINEISQEPLDFSAKDSLVFLGKDEIKNKKRFFAKDEIALKKRWVKWFKYNVLEQIYEELDSTEVDKDWNIDFIKTKAKTIKSKIATKIACRIEKKLNEKDGIANHIKSVFLNTFTSFYDPHTNYFSMKDLKSFENSLSRESGQLGLSLVENQSNEITVSYLVPGGAAWKSNEIHKGDKILKVKHANNTVLDINCTSVREIERFIQSSPNNKIILTIKKQGGSAKDITLYKEKVENEENIVKSLILEGSTKVGYISLPGFYTEFEEEDGAGCANDIAKEIIKLKRDNIEGLILDLRYNGGGAMNEALDLAGIFIDVGVFSIAKSRAEKPELLKDRNRGTIYDDALIVLINQESASASEILAAVLQDYNRAVIVGSPSFGKSTGQIILPIENNLHDSREEFGFVKVTVDKFYRVDGSTHQQIGVMPDIILPDVFSSLGFKESDYPTSLINDKIDKKVYFKPLETLPISELNKKSKVRIDKNERFQNIKMLTKEIDERFNKNIIIPLTPLSFKKYFDKQEEIYSQINLEDQKVVISNFKIINHNYDKEILEMSAHKKKTNDSVIENLKGDIYISEAYNIINDLIEVNKQTETQTSDE